MRELRRETLDVVHLRDMGQASPVPFAESLDAMIGLQKEGKIRHLGLSNVGPGELVFALTRTPIVSSTEPLQRVRAELARWRG